MRSRMRPKSMLARLLDLLAIVLCTLAAPLLLLGEWLRDQADALRYREAVLARLQCLDCDGTFCTFCTFDD